MGLPQLRRIAACKICATGSVLMAVNKMMHGDNSGSDGKKAEKMCRWMAKSHGNELGMTMVGQGKILQGIRPPSYHSFVD